MGAVPIHNQFRTPTGPTGAIVLDDFESNTNLAVSSSGGAVITHTLIGPPPLSLTPHEIDLIDDTQGYFNATRGVDFSWDRTNGVDYYSQGTVAATQDAANRHFFSFRMGQHRDQTNLQGLTLELSDNSGNVAYMDTRALFVLVQREMDSDRLS